MIFSIPYIFCLFSLLLCSRALAEDKEVKTPEIVEICRTGHRLGELEYEAVCGTLPLKDTEEKSTASMFYTAYFVKEAAETRPIIFCFNGGPGSSSLWLHLGLLGPKIAKVRDAMFTPPPSSYEDNPYTLLDNADLVFIDPICTGFSKPSPGADAKQFHSIEGDIDSFADFIRLFLTHFHRWSSPRYLLGESYGTLRAVGLANHLHDTHFIDLNGLILCSMCLDFQAYDFGNGNDLPYALILPSYAACAWYHKKLPAEQQNKTLTELVAEVEEFALHEYATALLLGDLQGEPSKEEIVTRLVKYTGLSPKCIRASHLRISNNNFFQELLKKESKVIGRFDGRYTASDSNQPEESMNVQDPSFEAIVGPFTSAFHQYLDQELKVQKSEPYFVLNADAVFPWNFSVNRVPAGLGYVYMSGKLTTLLEKTPNLKVFVASGYYDLATPYFASNYTLNHLKLKPALHRNIGVHMYEAGHMMYLNPESHAQMKTDLTKFLEGR